MKKVLAIAIYIIQRRPNKNKLVDLQTQWHFYGFAFRAVRLLNEQWRFCSGSSIHYISECIICLNSI